MSRPWVVIALIPGHALDWLFAVLGTLRFVVGAGALWEYSRSSQAAQSVPVRVVPRRPISPSVKRMILARDGHQCRHCGDTGGPFEFDHIVPWSNGRPDAPENLQTLCHWCNRRKGNRFIG